MSAGGTGFTEKTFTFLEELAENNNREWFDAHRDTFREYVDDPFVAVLEHVTTRLAGTRAPVRGGPATVFRINRDVRFSRDKAPYSTFRGGLLTPSGTKSEHGGLVYLQLNATGGTVAGGLYQPAVSRLDPLRQAMLEDPDEFLAVVRQLADTGRELDDSNAVKTMPRGYAEHAQHPLAPYLRLRQLVVTQPLPRIAWLDDSILDRVETFVLDVAPLLEFISSYR